MKAQQSIFSFVSVLFLAFFILFPADVIYGQKVLITKRTATWCPHCGAWGWDFAKALEDLDDPNVYLMRAHYSGDLISVPAQQITANFNASYQPEFYINEKYYNISSTNWQSQVNVFEGAIDDLREAGTSFSVFFSSSISGNTIHVNTNVVIEKDVAGSYYLGVYLLEDNVINNQASRGSEAIHNNVLREAFTGQDIFGETITENGEESGATRSYELSLEVPGGDVLNREFDILAVVWQLTDGKYSIKNINFAKAGNTTISDDLEIVDEKFTSFISGSELILESTSSIKSENLTAEVYNLSGQKLLVKRLSFLNNSKFQIDLDGLYNQGLFYLRLHHDERNIYTSKFFYTPPR